MDSQSVSVGICASPWPPTLIRFTLLTATNLTFITPTPPSLINITVKQSAQRRSAPSRGLPDETDRQTDRQTDNQYNLNHFQDCVFLCAKRQRCPISGQKTWPCLAIALCLSAALCIHHHVVPGPWFRDPYTPGCCSWQRYHSTESKDQRGLISVFLKITCGNTSFSKKVGKFFFCIRCSASQLEHFIPCYRVRNLIINGQFRLSKALCCGFAY